MKIAFPALAFGVLLLHALPAGAAEPPPPPPLVAAERIGISFGELKVLESGVQPGVAGAPPEVRAVARTQPMGWRLFINLRPVAPGEDGYFDLRFPLAGADGRIPFYLIGPQGEISHGALEVRIPAEDWDRLLAGPPPPPGTAAPALGPKASWLHLGLGTTSVLISQSSLAAYSEFALTTIQASLRRSFARQRARASLNASFMAFPLLKTDGISAHFLNLDGQVRYGWPVGPAGRWTFFANAGAYYRTMFVTDNRLGYHNVAGPLLYPSLRRSWADGSSAGVSLKLSPVTDGISFLGLASHEIALGADWAIVLRNRHVLNFGADLSAFRMVFSDVEISSLMLTLGVKYGL